MEINNGKPINDLGSRPINSHSKFNNSYRLASLLRFGEYTPHFVADVVPDDKHTLKCKHSVRSYTMSAPLMQNLKLKKDYFLIPLSAILPLNYDKFITTPNIGEDVPDDCGTTVSGFRGKMRTFYDNVISNILERLNDGNYDSTAEYIADLIKVACSVNQVFSNGGLLAALGCHTRATYKSNCDNFFDSFISLLDEAFSSDGAEVIVTFNPNNNPIQRILEYSGYVPGDNTLGVPKVSWHEFIQRVMDEYDFTLSGGSVDWDSLLTNYNLGYSDLLDNNPIFGFDYIPNDDATPIDIARCYAYQIVCAHFYTNDHVDYIYSAELYRQLLGSIIDSNYGSESFTWNGIAYLYDWCSAHYFEAYIANYEYFQLNNILNYLRLIFGYNRSLRFVDYFTGARTAPLAVGDAGVAVNDGYVNVVDTIQKRWYIKLWSQINRVGHRMSEQMKGLFPGAQKSTDWHEPIWLGHTDDDIYPEEVDNTGAAQVSNDNVLPVTSTFAGNSDRYAFEVSINDRYGILIGISYFDIARFYGNSIERPFFHVDRMDKFNPFLQFMGDQKIYGAELDSSRTINDTFGYQGRNMEYKQRFNQVVGDFSVAPLKNMFFLADIGTEPFENAVINPDYIRSWSSELDRFYKSLTGFSLGTYFHFIVLSTNELDSSRPMAYNPQID